MGYKHMRSSSLFFLVIVFLNVVVTLPLHAAESEQNSYNRQTDFGTYTSYIANKWKYIVGPPNTNQTQPYLNGAKIPHNTQWRDDDWRPEDWVETKGSIDAVMKGFYDNDVIVDQDVENGIPVLEVGETFLRLSDREKRHVAAFIDYVYEITSRTENGMFLIVYDKWDDTPLGLYTAQGLQLQ